MNTQNSYRSLYQDSSKKSTENPSIWERDIRLGPPLSLKDKQTLYHLLAILHGSGLQLMDCLDITREEASKKHIQSLLKDLQTEISGGNTFSEAMRSQKKIFGPIEVYNILMGEHTANLAQSFHNLSDHFEKRIKLRRKVTQALSYPLVVTCIAIGVLAFMLTKVVPMFKDIFDRFEAELPPITQAIMAISEFFGNYIWLIIGGIGLFLLLLGSFRKRPAFQRLSSRLLLNIPFLGPLMLKLHLSKLAYTFSLLLSAKISMDKSLDLLEQFIRFYPLKQTIAPIAEQVIAGDDLYTAIDVHKIYPAFFKQIIRVGEKTAKLDSMLHKLAEKLEEESENGIAQLTQILEPLLIVVLGLMVGIILVSMYLPMFELSNAMGG